MCILEGDVLLYAGKLKYLERKAAHRYYKFLGDSIDN